MEPPPCVDPRLQLFAGRYDFVMHIEEDGSPVVSKTNCAQISAGAEGLIWQQKCQGVDLPQRKLNLVSGPVFHDVTGRVFEVDGTLSKLRIDSTHVFEGVPAAHQFQHLQAAVSGGPQHLPSLHSLWERGLEGQYSLAADNTGHLVSQNFSSTVPAGGAASPGVASPPCKPGSSATRMVWHQTFQGTAIPPTHLVAAQGPQFQAAEDGKIYQMDVKLNAILVEGQYIFARNWSVQQPMALQLQQEQEQQQQKQLGAGAATAAVPAPAPALQYPHPAAFAGGLLPASGGISLSKLPAASPWPSVHADAGAAAAAGGLEQAVHENVHCDGCNGHPIIGIRFKATDLEDYDLCCPCFEKRDESCKAKSFVAIEQPVAAGTAQAFHNQPAPAAPGMQPLAPGTAPKGPAGQHHRACIFCGGTWLSRSGTKELCPNCRNQQKMLQTQATSGGPFAPFGAGAGASFGAGAPPPAPSSTDCPQLHGLEAFATPRPSFSCNVCDVTVAEGTAMRSCRKCNYDVCGSCFGRAPGVGAGGPVAGFGAAPAFGAPGLPAPPVNPHGGGGGGGGAPEAGDAYENGAGPEQADADLDQAMVASLFSHCTETLELDVTERQVAEAIQLTAGSDSGPLEYLLTTASSKSRTKDGTPGDTGGAGGRSRPRLKAGGASSRLLGAATAAAASSVVSQKEQRSRSPGARRPRDGDMDDAAE